MAGRRGLSYRGQQGISLLIVAIVPVLLGAAIVLGQVNAAVRADADSRALGAGRAVQTILGENAAALGQLAQSYATWSVLQSDVASLREQAIAQSVVDFQVSQGGVDEAVVMAGTHVVGGGQAADVQALQAMLGRALASGEAFPRNTCADLPGGVYQVSLQSIDLSGRSGPGVTAGGGRAGLAFAQRLGSDFVVQAKGLTGFEVAVYDATGTLTAASDQAIARQSAPANTALPADSDTLVSRRLPNDVVAVQIPLVEVSGQGPASDGSAPAPAQAPGGSPAPGRAPGSGGSAQAPTPTLVGTLVVATQLGLASTISASLVPYLAVLLALVLVFAASLAVYLEGLLRRRLGAVEAGLSAVAAGDLGARIPVAPAGDGSPADGSPAGGGDPLDRLAASHNRLAAALQRRDQVVWRSLDALEALRPERGPTNLLGDVLEAARSIFELDACWLRDETGALVAVSPPGVQPAPPGPALVSADLDALPGSRLEGAAAAVATWSVADRALFGLFAREAGVALRSAGLHEEASQRAERLGRANQLQREFVRGLGHNLQAPLARIRISSEDLAAASEDADPGIRRQAEAINADADRLTRVVRALLTSTRLDAGVFVPEQEPFALAPLVRRAWHALGSDRSLDLVDGSAGWLAVGDREAVEQVVWILLDNAVRYAPSGPVHVSIDPDGGRALLVRVRDEGPGVPRAERGLIFRRFQRGSTARGHDGTGLGLDVARRLVRTMGGQLRYEEAPEGGAIFAFTLPAEPARGQE
ncbi:MAG: sensor histidine kinase [Candidatus Limnocylindrales bacterium]